MNPCYICNSDPSSHSFSRIYSKDLKIHLFYSCPGKATKYYESSGVINHFIQHLEENNDYPWIYIFDCKGFTLGHASQIETSIELVNMIQNKYGKNLKKIFIINYNWAIKILLDTIFLFLSVDLKNILEISDKKLEEIQEFSFE